MSCGKKNKINPQNLSIILHFGLKNKVSDERISVKCIVDLDVDFIPNIVW